MKKIMTVLAALAIGVAAQAAEYTYSVFVNQKNGESVEYKFANDPVASFDGENLVMNVPNEEGTENLHIAYPIADIVNLTFERGESAVKGVKADMTVSVSRDMVRLSGLKAGTRVAIYDLAGRSVAEGNADASGSFAAAISQLQKGVYVVNAGKNSFKFIR